jgi:hypothetical protein
MRNAYTNSYQHPLQSDADRSVARVRLVRKVDAAYVRDRGKRKWASDAARVAFLLRRCRDLTGLPPVK